MGPAAQRFCGFGISPGQVHTLGPPRAFPVTRPRGSLPGALGRDERTPLNSAAVASSAHTVAWNGIMDIDHPSHSDATWTRSPVVIQTAGKPKHEIHLATHLARLSEEVLRLRNDRSAPSFHSPQRARPSFRNSAAMQKSPLRSAPANRKTPLPSLGRIPVRSPKIRARLFERRSFSPCTPTSPRSCNVSSTSSQRRSHSPTTAPPAHRHRKNSSRTHGQPRRRQLSRRRRRSLLSATLLHP